MLLFICNYRWTTTATKLHSNNNNENKKINLDISYWKLSNLCRLIFLLLLLLFLLLLCTWSNWSLAKMYPLVEASCGQEQYYIRVTLTFGWCFGQAYLIVNSVQLIWAKISQTLSIGGKSEPIRWEKEFGGNSPSFWDVFCKTLPTQNRIFLTFQNYGILDLPHVCICPYDKFSSKRLYNTVHLCWSYDLSIWGIPLKVDDISDP